MVLRLKVMRSHIKFVFVDYQRDVTNDINIWNYIVLKINQSSLRVLQAL